MSHEGADSAVGGSAVRERMFSFSDVLCTINTLRAGTTDAEERGLTEQLRELLDREILTRETLHEPLRLEDGRTVRLVPFKSTEPGEVLRNDISDAVVEVGGQLHRVHAHFVMSILHSGQVELKRMQPNWQAYCRELFQREGISDSCYVNIRLLDTGRLKNYNLKDINTAEDALRVAQGVELIFY